MAMDWFRWHHGSVTDPKFQLVAKKSGASVAEVLAVWACLLEEASQAEERGFLGAIDFEALDCTLGMDEGRCKAIYERMAERGLFTDDGAIEAWDRRQPKRERDDPTNAERQRTFRAKQNQVTPDNASVDQKKPRLDKSREDKKEKNTGAVALLSAKGIPEDLALDFNAIRKAKHAPLTATAIAGIEREAGKAGLTLEQALRECCARGWQSFKADWQTTNGKAAPQQEPREWHESKSGVERKAIELGVDPHRIDEQWPTFRQRVMRAVRAAEQQPPSLDQLAAMAAGRTA